MPTLRSGGIGLHYEDRGEGEPILLLHGFTSSFLGTWDGTGWVALLTASGRRVIGLDFPSHGQSDAAYDQGRCSPERLAANVVALLDRLALDRADLVGFSMGAGIALRVAMTYPGRVRRLVVGGIGDAALNPRHDPQQVARITDAFQLKSAEEITDPVAARIRQNADVAGRDLKGLLPYLQGGGWPGGLDELVPLEVPVLLFVAEAEQYMAKTDEIQRWLRHAEIVRLEGDHHSVLRDDKLKRRALEVESVDAEVERLRALGVAFETEPTSYPGWGIRAAHLRDPDGNLIEINELLPPEEWSEDLREEQSRYEHS